MLPGETVGPDGVTCDHDAKTNRNAPRPNKLRLRVCQSAAGYYLGYLCPVCGPYSRETDYMTKQDATASLHHFKVTGELLHVRT